MRAFPIITPLGLLSLNRYKQFYREYSRFSHAKYTGSSFLWDVSLSTSDPALFERLVYTKVPFPRPLVVLE